jgi:CrcB protein
MAVNVVGSSPSGLLAVRLSPAAALFLITGVLGGFTTFSAFSLDTLRLIDEGHLGAAALYVGGSVGLSLLACGLGFWIGRLG